MTGNTLYKRIEQGYKENYCDGTYTFELVRAYNYEDCDYLLRYTYKTGEMIEITVRLTKYGEVLFYSPVHKCNYSNFNNHVKSVINVCRMLFDLIESNKDAMIKYYGVESTIETTATETEATTTETETSEQEKEESEYHPQNIERFPNYPANMLNESGLAAYGYYTDEQNLIKKDYSRDKNCKSLDSKTASFIYNWNVNMLSALYDGEITSIYGKPNVRTAHTIEYDLYNKNPTKLNLFRQLQQNLKDCYECKEYSSTLYFMQSLEDQCENLSFCGNNIGVMFFRKVNDALREWLK